MLRVVTYNVHSCVGADRKADPARIAEVIARCEGDIIALQELDVRRQRTGGIDQAHAIATHLGMKAHFHPAMAVMEELYGDAILTALPVRQVKAAALPSRGEPRGALWAAVDAGGVELQVLTTHLGLGPRERSVQIAALLGPGWIGAPEFRPPFVVLGDFNTIPSSPLYRRLSAELKPAQSGRPRPKPTFPARLPLLRLDHIFVDKDTAILGTEVPADRLARAASDHLPLIAELDLSRHQNPPRSSVDRRHPAIYPAPS